MIGNGTLNPSLYLKIFHFKICNASGALWCPLVPSGGESAIL
jgi:hypothetical protein